MAAMIMMMKAIASRAACSQSDHQTSRVPDRFALGDWGSVG
jgi:hypothetical protein